MRTDRAPMELISVIVPVYNAEAYLKRCVDSICNQSYKNLEIILVDDGSPDACPRMCDEMKMEDFRIQVIHKKNCGQGFARNSGLEIASGTFVTFIDSDDWISLDHIENLYNAIKESDADAAIGGYIFAGRNGQKKECAATLDRRLYQGSSVINDIVLPLIGPDEGYPSDVQVESSACMNLYRMDVIRTKKLQFISERVTVAEDLYFNIDFFCNANRIVVTDEVGYYYFENNCSFTRKYDPKRFERTMNFYSTIRERISAYGLEAQAAYRAERSFLMKIRVAIRHIVFSDLPRKQKFSEIKMILENALVQKVLQNYPVDTFVPAMCLLAKRMRAVDAFGVYHLMKLREMGRQQKLLKAMLNRMGIEKNS